MKVVIIGAGPAGLSAGLEIKKQNKKIDVVIVEECNQPGGISKTINYKGNRMDLGGHRFFTKDDRVNKFWEEEMPLQGVGSIDDIKLNRKKTYKEGGPNPEKEDNVMLVRERVSRIYYLRKFFDYPISLKFETIKNLGFVRTMQSGFSYLKSIFFKKKEDSLENFYINRFGKKLYSMFFEGYTEKLWGRHPSEISADWGSQRVKGISIMAVLKDAFSKAFHLNKNKVETSLIEEYHYPKFGPGEMWEKVASDFIKLGGKISYNTKVTKIKTLKNKVVSIDCEKDGKKETISGDVFVSSMPIKDLVEGMSRVPKDVKRVATNLPYRDFVTIGLLVKKLDLKNETDKKTINNIIPDCWMYIQEPNVKMGRIQVFNNWSPYMVKDLFNTVWIGLEYFCDEGDSFWNMSEEELKKFGTSELMKMDIISSESYVLDGHVEKVKKAYPAYFDTYTELDKVIDYLNKYDNLYCIGRNGQHRYNNMDHSVLTGLKAADVITGKSNDKQAIWNVNTEKEYHEEK